MIGYLMRIGCSIALCCVYLYAQNIENKNDAIINSLKNVYIKNLPYPNVLIDSYDMEFENKQYFVATMQNYNKNYLGNIALSFNCIKVFKKLAPMQEFCFNGDFIIKIEHKMPFFTIKTYKQDRIGNITNTYLTFKLYNDRFYLHQYSRENENVSNESNAESIKSHIYYRQPRDDPKKENLIPLDSINDELLQGLENKSQYLPVIQQGQSQ